MQQLERDIQATREKSPTGRIGAEYVHGVGIRFFALTTCKYCAGEHPVTASSTQYQAPWGWYKGDYNRAEQYADSVQNTCNCYAFKGE